MPWITFDSTGKGERTSPKQNGAWVLEPFYRYCVPHAVNPALGLVFSAYGNNCSPDLRHKPAMDFLRKRFPYPVWLHVLVPPATNLDGGNIPHHLMTNAFFVIDIMTKQNLTYAQRKYILNTRLPTIGIAQQAKCGMAYTTPTVPEALGFELCYCLESFGEDTPWAQSLYGGVVAKKLSSLYEINPFPLTPAASRSALFWHFHFFKA